ncbi:hypothetical protein RJ639_041722 [Escallonia herrerae]|uniref:Pentatricopeptide repeat-containing protein n=1 Tax=Escallonia herrerae TaxID=1293975 RepID=A0AA88WGQ1_9ASTE|nr:hypothetical protein RJ639_041722 [Escallonia herrerae]
MELDSGVASPKRLRTPSEELDQNTSWGSKKIKAAVVDDPTSPPRTLRSHGNTSPWDPAEASQRSPTTTHSISQAAEVIREAAPVLFVPLSCRRPNTEKKEMSPLVQLHISIPSSGSVKALPLSSSRVPTISLTSSQRSVTGENDVLSPAQLSKKLLVHFCTNAPKAGHCKYGLSLHVAVIKTGMQCDVVVSNHLLNVYAKCGNLNSARQMFNGMSERNLVTWSVMISGYDQGGKPLLAVELLSQMQVESNEYIFAITYLIVILFGGTIGHSNVPMFIKV